MATPSAVLLALPVSIPCSVPEREIIARSRRPLTMVLMSWIGWALLSAVFAAASLYWKDRRQANNSSRHDFTLPRPPRTRTSIDSPATPHRPHRIHGIGQEHRRPTHCQPSWVE